MAFKFQPTLYNRMINYYLTNIKNYKIHNINIFLTNNIII